MRQLPRPLPPDARPHPRDRAFVVFLMFNDSYLPGALMAAYGLQRQRSLSSRVCVVTPEITPTARDLLGELFDDIVEVDPIGVPEAGSSPDQVRTGSARLSGAALTRFASLRLGPDGDLGCAYEKLVVIDADLLPVSEFEELWFLPAPAGIINEHRDNMADIDNSGALIVDPESLRTGRWKWHDIYEPVCGHGDPIPQELTDRVADDYANYGVNASLVVIEPSMDMYADLMAWVATPEISELVQSHWRWVDQQAATLYWSGQWTNVDTSYSALYGYPALELLRGLHFAGVKPWSWRKKGFRRRMHRFPDYQLWAEFYLEMLDEHPVLRSHGPLRRLGEQTELALKAGSD